MDLEPGEALELLARCEYEYGGTLTICYRCPAGTSFERLRLAPAEGGAQHR